MAAHNIYPVFCLSGSVLLYKRCSNTIRTSEVQQSHFSSVVLTKTTDFIRRRTSGGAHKLPALSLNADSMVHSVSNYPQGPAIM